MNQLFHCPACRRPAQPGDRFCTQCGAPLARPAPPARRGEVMNLPILYAMVVALILAVLVPPWETPPAEPPQFLGFHLIGQAPPSPGGGTGIVSRLLLTIEVVTIAVAGLYFSWLFRGRS